MELGEKQRARVQALVDRHLRDDDVEDVLTDLYGRIIELQEALSLFRERIEKNGMWDDGCFYYNRVSASELQCPLRLADRLLGNANSRSLRGA